ncbi:WD40 repeat domain-containing serine/threonine protein kinase [Sinosporangium siamense]|uniref:Protein kinase domain-containing protein n=1 Tax=Sinosporangium siamense TaxID=1367973 RepID=A0A919RNI5_9ACTN|nr:serine/threonine-protein kinase [Sinosporangium siamense]GII95259.1 hypothetical protein Ssi02_54900 [Sinosporangium siamense]
MTDARELVNGRYQLIEPIGVGGMGKVWRAYDQVLERDVAVKEILFPRGLQDTERETLTRRAMREARSAARLNHPGIVTVYDVALHDGAPAIIMELVPGRSLAQTISGGVRLPPERVAAIGVGLLEAVAEAHAAGIVHRDLKPANVLVSGNRVVITDFGIASMAGDATLTASGMLIGTPSFMAPEQARGREVSPAWDLWALGATLYAAAEGRAPYTGTDLVSVLSALLSDEPEPPVHAGPLTPVLTGLLQKNPAERLGTEQALEALRAVVAGNPPADAGTPVTAAGRDTVVPTPGLLSTATPPPEASAARAIRVTVDTAVSGPDVSGPAASVTVVPPTIAHPAATKGADRLAADTAADKKPPSPRRRELLIWGVGGLAALGIGAATTFLLTGGAGGRDSGVSGANSAASRGGAWGLAQALEQGFLVNAVDFSHGSTPLGQGPLFAVVGDGASLKLWNPADGRNVADLTDAVEPAESMVALAFGPDGTIATGAGNTTLLWNLSARAVAYGLLGYDRAVKALAFSPDGRYLAAGSEDYVSFWDLTKAGDAQKTGRNLTFVNGASVPGTVTSVAFSPDGKTLATAGFDEPVRLWEIKGGAPVESTASQAYGDGANVVAFSPDGRFLVSAGADNYVHVWDSANPRKPVESALLEGHNGQIFTVAFSPDGNLLASAGDEGFVRLWDFPNSKPLTDLTGHEGRVTSVAFSKDGAVLASGGHDGYVRLWRRK